MPKNLAALTQSQDLKTLKAFKLALEGRAAEHRLPRYKPYSKQIAFHEAGGTYRERLFRAGNQLGKFHPVSEPILTPKGWVAIGDLKVGDEVIAGDGSVTIIIGVFPQGIQPFYRLTFDQGETSLAGGPHLWQVTMPAHRWLERNSHGKIERNPNYRKQSVVDTDELIRRFYKTPGVAPPPKQRVLMPHVGAVRFTGSTVRVDPYVLGALLGDGCLRNQAISISSQDPEIVEAVRVEAKRHGATDVVHASGCDYRVVAPKGLRSELSALSVYGKLSHEKFVPPSYLLNDLETRLALFQGLMDTDGSCDRNGTIEFSSTSPRLADDVAFLARSFGGKVRINQRITSYTYKGEKKQGRPSYRLWIRLPQVSPFRLARKMANLVRPVSTCDEHVLHTIEPAGTAESVCISVAHPSRLYVTNDFIVTHNTMSSAAEIAMHACGQYPDWWRGKAFRTPTTGAVASETSLLTRDGMQVHLFGYPKYPIGTGMIPKDCILDLVPNRHVADFYDYVRVKFGGGGDVQAGESLVYLRSYDQGRARIQAMTLDYFALDEEPPLDYYIEALTRTNKVLGPVWLTFTPLKGMSDVVNRFLIEKPNGSIDINMTIEDVEHYTRAQKDAIISSYPAHEREARANGVPILGSGRVFSIDEKLLSVEAFQIPAHWPRICAVDFGWDHPTAAVWLAWDRDNDVVYVIDCYRVKEQPVAIHAHAIKARGQWIPVAWPHDGNNDVAAGPNLADQYRGAGLEMLSEHAQLPEVPGGSAENTRQSRMSVEAGVQQMLDTMMAGQFKVFSHLADWWEEFRLYHRKDGKIVKERDDLMAATRYAFVSRRFAKVNPAKASRPSINRPGSWRA